jgi:2-oxoglutarate dehydrogenase E2 component (dihydrolipoamide succinyltransferase)
MVASVQTSAHAIVYRSRCDQYHKWRDKVKNSFRKEKAKKLTYTPIFMEAVAKALKDFSGMNISLLMAIFIIKKKNINWMARVLPNGNLIVPSKMPHQPCRNGKKR